MAFPSQAGFAQGKREGRIAGLRLAVEQLMKWVNDARAHDDQEQGEVLEDAGLYLAQIADRLEEEG